MTELSDGPANVSAPIFRFRKATLLNEQGEPMCDPVACNVRLDQDHTMRSARRIWFEQPIRSGLATKIRFETVPEGDAWIEITTEGRVLAHNLAGLIDGLI